MKRLVNLILVLLISLSLFSVFNFPRTHATEDPLRKLQDAINLAKEYIDRLYCEINSTHAVCKDFPGLPIMVKDETDGMWIAPAKHTYGIDPEIKARYGFKAGCLMEYISFGDYPNHLTLKYKWDVEADATFDGLVTKVEYWAVNETHMQAKIEVISKSTDHDCTIYFDGQPVITNAKVGDSWQSQPKYRGWTSARYVMRSGTKMLANAYRYLFNETEKAQKLENTWFGANYTRDQYDPVFNASNSYPDEVTEGPRLGWWNDVYSCPWPEPEVFNNCPWVGGITYPYRSQCHHKAARELALVYWINGFSCRLPYAIHLMNKYGKRLWTEEITVRNWINPLGGFRTFYYMPARDLVKQIIDQASMVWEASGHLGMGWEIDPGLNRLLWRYPGYVTYQAGLYLRALVTYYHLTGDEWYATRADEVAGRLLQVQVPSNGRIDLANGDYILRPDHAGGFLCGYVYGHSFDFVQTSFWFADLAFNVIGAWTDFWHNMAPESYKRDEPELSGGGFTNHETTLICLAALWYYQKWVAGVNGHQPLLTPEVEFKLVFSEASSITVEESEQGFKLLDFSEANHGRIRLFIEGSIWGETWYKITYTWEKIEISQTLHNFRTALEFYYPAFSAYDGNSLEIWVEIYDSNGILVVSDYRKPKELDGISGNYETIISINNLTMLTELSPGTYTIKLIFRFSCGWAGGLGIGMADIGGIVIDLNWMEILLFGYDSDPPEELPKPTYRVTVSGEGDDGSSQIKVYFNETDVTYYQSSADMAIYEYEEQVAIFEVTEVADGYYFWYWHVENRRLGISENITANPMCWRVNHDYNITACFGTTEYPPPSYVSLEIDVLLGYTGNKMEGACYTQVRLSGVPEPEVYHFNGSAWIAGTGKWKYPKGTVITLNASLPEGYEFLYWWPPSGLGRVAELNLTCDTLAVALYNPPYVRLHFKDAKTGQSISEAFVVYGGYSWKVIDGVILIGKHQQYELLIMAEGYYGKQIIVLPDASSPDVTIQLSPVEFSGGGAGTGAEKYLPLSRTITFYATIPWSNTTSTFFVDTRGLIYCEPLFNRTARLKLIVHYGTYYPAIEIYTENVAYVRFDIDKLYEYYCKESFSRKITETQIVGLVIDADSPLIIEIEGLASKPNEIWKKLPTGEEYKIEDWSWLEPGTIVLSFMPGDPTVSLLWSSLPLTINDIVLQLTIVVIALACVAALMTVIKRHIE